MRVARAPAGEEHLPLIGNTIVIGVFEKERIGCHRDDQAAVVSEHARGDGELLGEDLAVISPVITIGINKPHDPVAALDRGGRVFLWRLDEIVGVVDAFGDIHGAIGIETHRQRFARQQRLSGKEFDSKTVRRDRMLSRLLGCQWPLHRRDLCIALTGAARRIERHLRRLVFKRRQARGWPRHHGPVDIRPGGHRIAAGGEPDAPLDEIVEAWVAPRPLVMPPSGVENAALAFLPHPGPRFTVVALDALFQHGAAAIVVLRMDVGFVPALEATEILHHGMTRSHVHGAKLTDTMLLKLRPDKVDPGR